MPQTETLRAGQQIPHFHVQGLDHTSVAYPEIWQRKNLLLVLLTSDASPAADDYVAGLQARMPELTAHDTVCVMSRDAVAGLPRPGVIIADRWGEIQVVAGGRVEDLPPAGEILESLRFVQVQCPECQGEAR